MLVGLQTHIEAWVDSDELRFLYGQGVRLARIAARECSEDTMLSNVRDAKAVGFTVIVTLDDASRIRLLKPLLTPGDFVECGNEYDYDWPLGRRGDGDLRPSEYRTLLDAFCAVGLEVGVPIGGPVCSNTNSKCIRWARAVRGTGWPKGMDYLTWHSYDPHENTLFAEMEALAEGRPIVITEFGYPSHAPITEDQQAEKKRHLWPLYAKYHGACWFQIHDGPDQSLPDDCFGVRAFDGRWKPAAYVFPQSDPVQENEMSDATFCVSQSQSFAVGNGFATYYPKGQTETVLSVQPDGKKETRPKSAVGAWETWRPSADGQRAVFYETAEVYAYPLVP